ncbi:lysostaphin resistance A-like protein [Allofournierella sp.]|uniref:CPBP family intramembrane glutamic endopeptidase n=1 Tax=Allofournierella sp. TaxID=1940256 RepID=UPI003AB64054
MEQNQAIAGAAPAAPALPGFKRSVSRLGLAFMVYMVVCQLAQLACISAVQLLWPEALNNGWAVWLLTDLPLYLVAFPLFLLTARLAPNTAPAPSYRARRESMGPKQLAQLFCVIIAVTYIGNYISLGINALLALIKGAAVVNPLETVAGGGTLLANLIFGALVPAVGEEYVFRGVAYKKLAGFGETPFILVSGLVFGLFHGNLSQLIYAFAIGCVLAWLACRTGTLVYGMGLHFVVNCWGIGIAPLLVQSEAGSIAAVAFILIAGVLGVVFAVRYWRTQPHPGPGVGLPAHPVRAVLLAPGMLAYELVCLALIVMVILM